MQITSRQRRFSLLRVIDVRPKAKAAEEGEGKGLEGKNRGSDKGPTTGAVGASGRSGSHPLRLVSTSYEFRLAVTTEVAGSSPVVPAIDSKRRLKRANTSYFREKKHHLKNSLTRLSFLSPMQVQEVENRGTSFKTLY